MVVLIVVSIANVISVRSLGLDETMHEQWFNVAFHNQ